MKNEIFLQKLENLKIYLKPELYEVLVRVSVVISDEMRIEMIEELESADIKMEKLAIYEKQREGIIRKGIETLKNIYNKAKDALCQRIQREENADRVQAENIIANI